VPLADGARQTCLVETGERDDVLAVGSDIDALWADGHSRVRATELVIERSIADAVDARTVVLVEGVSDQIAVHAVASTCGRDLRDEGTAVVPMGGATNIGRFVELFGPGGRDVALVGLYDAAEEAHFARVLARAGLGQHPDRLGLEALGFFVCVDDLEDEFIRAAGPQRVLDVIERQGELPPFRTLQNEPHHRGRTLEQQLHRFIANSGRKYRYPRLLALELDAEAVPEPLARLLAHVRPSVETGD
jgi:hypothetical protein